MELTDEQKAILDSLDNQDEKNIKVDSVAGSGKSYILVELARKAKKQNPDCKIMYFVFNRLMLEESKDKFFKEGIDVTCNTIHSFALGRFKAIKNIDFEPLPNLDFKTFIIIKNKKEYSKKWISFKNVKELLNQYCLSYDNIDDFCKNVATKPILYNIRYNISVHEIELFKDLLKYMINNNIYTHALYLKCYACECSDLIYTDIIELDEAQDCLNMFYLILKRFRYNKLYATGDRKQNIYQFCKTVNIFDKIEGVTYPLSVSFRINNESCDLANKVLDFCYDDFKYGDLKNIHNETKISNENDVTVLFRRNGTMLNYASDLLKSDENIKVNFMSTNGGSSSDGFDNCFNDMLYFYHKLLECTNIEESIKFKNTFKFKFCNIVNDYNNMAIKSNLDLYRYLSNNKSVLELDYKKYFEFFNINKKNIVDIVNKIKQSEENNNPDKTYHLSTVHRYKGLETEHVIIADDEWSFGNKAEQNLIYIALTRNTRKLNAKPITNLLEEKLAHK